MPHCFLQYLFPFILPLCLKFMSRNVIAPCSFSVPNPAGTAIPFKDMVFNSSCESISKLGFGEFLLS